MIEAMMIRDEIRSGCILSTLTVKEERFQILERPWLDNRPNVSCIPAGVYEATFMERSSSGKYRNVYWLRDVPNRTGILIHHGNVVADTRGCLLIGDRRGWLAGERAVLNSRSALRVFVELLNREPMRLAIQGEH
ncbi:DUF5675 family protein [Hahella aquimaris]|uniref:DUF5675 family protein n=1 Tax=Hahella sp. HNIBRBA332 TaxID=3015983 RepID=UPI00273AC3A7|nr:DUF5675 family protein [Hahella sp. HNIBRBA332]WLQ13320.1 DUF5675 family protein [Hahella sp. HNIBRBA332]